MRRFHCHVDDYRLHKALTPRVRCRGIAQTNHAEVRKLHLGSCSLIHIGLKLVLATQTLTYGHSHSFYNVAGVYHGTPSR
jgi:hypothetical protein